MTPPPLRRQPIFWAVVIAVNLIISVKWMALDWQDVSSDLVSGVFLAIFGAVATGVTWLAREAIKKRWLPMSIWLFVLFGIVVGGGTGAIAYVAYKRLAPTTQLPALIRWDKFGETLRPAWKFEAWVTVTSRSEMPMVLRFAFALENESHSPRFRRFDLQIDGVHTNTVQVQPYDHRDLYIVVAMDPMLEAPIDVTDPKREYRLLVEDQVTGYRVHLEPFETYDIKPRS